MRPTARTSPPPGTGSLPLPGHVRFAKGHRGTWPWGTPREQEAVPTRFTFRDSNRELRATGVYALGILPYIAGRAVRAVYGVRENYFFAERHRIGTEAFG